jgi:hypothetical protein
LAYGEAGVDLWDAVAAGGRAGGIEGRDSGVEEWAHGADYDAFD